MLSRTIRQAWPQLIAVNRIQGVLIAVQVDRVLFVAIIVLNHHQQELGPLTKEIND